MNKIYKHDWSVYLVPIISFFLFFGILILGIHSIYVNYDFDIKTILIIIFYSIVLLPQPFILYYRTSQTIEIKGTQLVEKKIFKDAVIIDLTTIKKVTEEVPWHKKTLGWKCLNIDDKVYVSGSLKDGDYQEIKDTILSYAKIEENAPEVGGTKKQGGLSITFLAFGLSGLCGFGLGILVGVLNPFSLSDSKNSSLAIAVGIFSVMLFFSLIYKPLVKMLSKDEHKD